MKRALVPVILLVGSLWAQPSEVTILALPGAPNFFLLAKHGKVAAADCDDGKLRLWSLPEGRPMRTIEIGKRMLFGATISDDGAWLAVGDQQGEYTLWSVATGGEQWRLKLPYYPAAMAFSPDGKRLAIAPAGEPVQVWEPGSNKKLFELQRVVGGSQTVVFSPDGARIATADSDTVVRVYDGRNGELLARNGDFLVEPLAAAFTRDGKHLLTGGGDKVVATIDIATGGVVRKSGRLADPVAYLEVSQDGKLASAALMHADNMQMPAPVIVSETDSGRTVREWMPPSHLVGGAWTSDGRLLVATWAKDGIHLWRVQ
jgi:WD40 repeat protein